MGGPPVFLCHLICYRSELTVGSPSGKAASSSRLTPKNRMEKYRQRVAGMPGRSQARGNSHSSRYAAAAPTTAIRLPFFPLPLAPREALRLRRRPAAEACREPCRPGERGRRGDMVRPRSAGAAEACRWRWSVRLSVFLDCPWPT